MMKKSFPLVGVKNVTVSSTVSESVKSFIVMFGVPVKIKMSVKVRANLLRVVSNVCKIFRINISDATAQSNYFRLLYPKSWCKYL